MHPDLNQPILLLEAFFELTMNIVTATPCLPTIHLEMRIKDNTLNCPKAGRYKVEKNDKEIYICIKFVYNYVVSLSYT